MLIKCIPVFGGEETTTEKCDNCIYKALCLAEDYGVLASKEDVENTSMEDFINMAKQHILND